MSKTLTKSTVASAQAIEQTKLTNKESAYFKLIFSDQIRKKYRFNTIHHPPSGTKFSEAEYSKVLHALGQFIDKTVHLTITDVEREYLRKPFNKDTTIDPETKQEVKIQHLCLFDKAAAAKPPLIPSDSIRLHGYYRGEYFILIRLDWFHKFKTEGL